MLRRLACGVRSANWRCCGDRTFVRVASSSSFIEKAKLSGAQSLLGAFTHRTGRFDHCMRGLQIKRIGDGEVECEIAVDEHLHRSAGAASTTTVSKSLTQSSGEYGCNAVADDGA